MLKLGRGYKAGEAISMLRASKGQMFLDLLLSR